MALGQIQPTKFSRFMYSPPVTCYANKGLGDIQIKTCDNKRLKGFYRTAIPTPPKKTSKEEYNFMTHEIPILVLINKVLLGHSLAH